ncbi:MAG TPA: hypothetical protein VFV53_02140 [Candidatus Limnocylindrales bacterium]|nr:hypothetical protein [Candidatus Limnocylindrales bacterium]
MVRLDRFNPEGVFSTFSSTNLSTPLPRTPVDLVLEPDGIDLRLRLHTTPTLGGMFGCIALGVERSVVIELSAPIDGRTVRLVLD